MNELAKNYESLFLKYKELEDSFLGQDIHDKRVILRKVFSILNINGNNISKTFVDNFKLFGKLRDIQVQLIKLEKYEGKYNLKNYIDYLKKTEKKLIKEIRSFSKKSKLEFPVLDNGEFKLDIIILNNKLNQIKNLFQKNIDEKSFHRLRIKFKEFRYSLESYLINNQLEINVLEGIKHYQDDLGEIQDLEVLIDGLRKFYKNKIVLTKKLIKDKKHKLRKFKRNKKSFLKDCLEIIEKLEKN